ncbi:SAF domain-containing protein [Microbacterium aquilitoris]|uniref:SAF domain-containing protein n=1 Tax=Microbacterium aquilitoris TaxID=3067307 RepID=A0ABU3GJJ2_9MICO|nr:MULTISPECIES: SAF domain-containing protein [unclassified Microbacterium]MDT3330589.1 SAF domain-containing protein [Microbacterium sp. KSW-18]MDT3344656.1 SAF domain-containing protein [Microbacterium sp. KSW2-22]
MTTPDTVRPAPRAFWADARFLLGIALIIASVAGVWLVVASARQTAPVFAAARTIVPGQTVTADDLRVVDVALGSAGETYVSPASLQPGVIATRTILEGELVPQAAVDDADAATTTTIVIRTSGDVSASVVAGSVVEVWAAPAEDGGTFGEPRILVPSATVVSVTRDDAVVSGTDVSLEIVIPRADVAESLAALADGANMSVVPVAGEAQ